MTESIMTTVHIVVRGVEYEGEQIIGVFATREAAENFGSQFGPETRHSDEYIDYREYAVNPE